MLGAVLALMILNDLTIFEVINMIFEPASLEQQWCTVKTENYVVMTKSMLFQLNVGHKMLVRYVVYDNFQDTLVPRSSTVL